jgi:DnaK suppressor protein
MQESGQEIGRIAERLREHHRELLAEYAQCRAELQLAADGDSADEDAAAQTYSSVADILSHLLREIRDVEEALERFRNGRYGQCADCGRPITASRLRAMPTARRCMKCQVGCERRAG